jgi:amino acid adenylation domain-containing protein
MNDLEQRLARLSDEQREQLRQASMRERTSRARIRPRPRPERIPLTFGQRRLWLQDRLDPGQVAYNSAWGLWLHGVANPADLRHSLQSLVDRHEGLRTVYPAIGGEPFQRILPQLDLPWREARAEGDDAEARRADATRLAREDAGRSFDLENGPVLRVLLVAVEPDLHLLLITFHHIAIDGWSVSTLMREFFGAYNRLRSGQAIDAAAPELQIADVALWQQEQFGGERMRAQLEFWKSQLAGAPATLDLPTDRQRPATRSYRGGAWSADIPPDVYARLQTLARESRATVSSVVLAAYQIVLSRYSGQDDLVMAMGIAGRSRLELESVVGFFINLLPLRADLSGTPSFAEYLERTHAVVLRAMEHADAPFERILEEQRLPRSVGYTPFAQATYFFQSYPARGESLSGLRIEDAKLQDVAPDTAQTDLQLFVNQHREGELIFEYSADLYDEATIRRMGGHLLTLLAAVADAPQTPITRLPLLTAGERTAIEGWNATDRDLPAEPTIAALFAGQAAATPDAVAVRFGARAMSYAELDRRADAVARAVRDAGAGPGVLVGLYVERTLEMLIGLVGIVKAGAAYVPLDPGFPRDRLGYMVETSQSTIIVTQASLRDQLPAPVPTVVVVDADAPLADGEAMRGNGVGPHDPAYVIFTSGSTGKPKGVEILQRSAVNLIRSIAREPGIAAGDTICAISTLSFDIALTELVIPLTVGASILLVDRDTVRDGLRLRRLIEAEPLTLMQATPATWRMLLDVGWPGKPTMRIISTGEALPRELADRLLPMGRELWNLYGPTETTVYSALCRVEPGTGPIIVGRPVDNTTIHIVDRNMQPLPVGVPGELLIGGAGLAAGYRGRPDLTAEKFIADPFSAAPDARLYRTGDLAFWRADGTVQVVGRIDHQIKLRGFRIELGEIESVLADLPALDQVVVHCREDRPGDPRLVAYYTCTGERPDPADLRAELKRALPEYMIPSAFVALDAFPLTPNGKVDRRALPAPEAASGSDDDFVAPRTDDERALAALWAELLHVPRVDVRADFFDLGGHSLLATQMLARIEYDYGIELPLRALFESPTLEQLAARVASECEAADRAAMAALLGDIDNLSEAELLDRLSDAGVTGAA